MPTSKSSLIHLNQLSQNKIELLFQNALQLKDEFLNQKENHFVNENSKQLLSNKTAALLFFEPSTRTRFSFESACVRAGFHPMVLDGQAGTSLEKGETYLDTVLNIEAMKPAFLVIRCGADLDLMKLSQMISTPIINAGWAAQGHPTQALLDALSLFERWKTLDQKKILFVGDIKHSRVVASHFELASLLNYQVGLCAPTSFRPDSAKQNKFIHFEKLDQGLQWADAVMALRVQKERHDGISIDINHYHQNYGLNNESLKSLKPQAFIMHPGPINYGVEMHADILKDPRSIVFQQVENGVFLRQSLILNLVNKSFLNKEFQ